MDTRFLGAMLPLLSHGLAITLAVTIGAALLAVFMAMSAGLMSLSSSIWMRILSRIYVEVFRGTSALVQLFWFYFALPLWGINLDPLSVGILVLGLNIGAYGAEVVRGAIQSVPPGQTDAALSLNLSAFQTMRYVVLPQAIAGMLPPAGNLMIELLKGTALVSLITLTDLTRAAILIRDKHLDLTFEIFGLVLVLYFGISLFFTLGFRRVEGLLAARQGRSPR